MSLVSYRLFDNGLLSEHAFSGKRYLQCTCSYHWFWFTLLFFCNIEHMFCKYSVLSNIIFSLIKTFFVLINLKNLKVRCCYGLHNVFLLQCFCLLLNYSSNVYSRSFSFINNDNPIVKIKMMKGKAPMKHSLHEKTAASVVLKQFISGND